MLVSGGLAIGTRTCSESIDVRDVVDVDGPRRLGEQLRQGFGHEREATQAKKRKIRGRRSRTSESKFSIFPAPCSSGPSSLRSAFEGTSNSSPSADVDRFRR